MVGRAAGGGPGRAGQRRIIRTRLNGMNEEHSRRRDTGRNGRAASSPEVPRVRARNRLKRVNGFSKLAPANGGHVVSRNGHSQKLVLITGGAGFIGTNVAHRL